MRCPLLSRPIKLLALLTLVLPLWLGCADAPELSSLEQGKQLFSAGRMEEALAALDMAIFEQPQNIEAYHYRGRTYAALRRWDRAIADYDAAMQIAPDDPEAYHLRSEAHAQLGNEELRFADALKAKQLDPLAKLLYARTIPAAQFASDNTEKKKPEKQPDESNPQSGSLGRLLKELDEPDLTANGEGGQIPSSTSLRQTLTGAAGLPVEGQTNLIGLPHAPAADAAAPGGEEPGSTNRAAISNKPRTPIASDAPRDGSPPPVFETHKQREAITNSGDAANGDTSSGSNANDSRRAPGIATGTIRLAPTPIRSPHTSRGIRVTSPFDAQPSAEKRRLPKTPVRQFNDPRTTPDLTLGNNPYSQPAASNRTKAGKSLYGRTGTALALPKDNALLRQRQQRSADRLNPQQPPTPHKHGLPGLNPPPSKRPSTDKQANPLAPSPLAPSPLALPNHPGATPPRTALPADAPARGGTLGVAPLRSNPYDQIEPDAFNPYKTTPVTGNPYGASVPNLLPITPGGPANFRTPPLTTPLTPFGGPFSPSQSTAPRSGGFGSSRSGGPLSGLYGSGSSLGGTAKRSTDLKSLLRPNSGLNLIPGGSQTSPFSIGESNRRPAQSTAAPRPRIGAPRARGFGRSSIGPSNNRLPR
ncbi:MAG: tetratricopeptide repeat protein [Planctomycetes bacterium]|nr:tetratricopeptide repeat protein [Planctomycetota bacterium]